MYSSSLLFLALVWVFPLPSISFRDGGNEFSACRSIEYPCGGNRYEVNYPFRLPGSPPFCGYPGFNLRCPDNSSLLMTIGGKDFVVNSLDYGTQTLHLTDHSFAGEDQSCNSFTGYDFGHKLSGSGYSSANAWLTVYFNCSHRLQSLFPLLRNLSCFEGVNGYQSFYTPPDDPPLPASVVGGYCASSVSVPISGYQRNDGAYDFPRALRRGFALEWTAGDGWCKRCTDSEGICGYDGSPVDGSRWSDGAACFCSYGSCVLVDEAVGKTGRKIGAIIGIISTLGCVIFVCTVLAMYRREFCKRVILTCIISTLGCVIFVCAVLAKYWRELCNTVRLTWKKYNNDQNIEDFLVKYRNLAPKRYTYSDLQRITKSFHDKLGQGGYGTVFKGTLDNGREVAVKVLRESKGNGDEFLNEVSSIAMTSHVNIVSLLGFCYEQSKRALIYDFMCNGSLEKFVYSGKPRTTPEWEWLHDTAVGIARGLEYLHRGCSTRIVHFDIKPHNILLDQDFCPKISDFGLAKLCLKKESIISMAGLRGTIGYIAPEVFSRIYGDVSSKSDVYSYGMMVLEMVGGRKNATMDAESNEMYFPHWIYEHLKHDGDVQACGVTAETEERARKMTIVGLWCIQTKPQDRPTITEVIQMLEGNIDDLDLPPKPYLSTPLQSLVGSSSIHDGCQTDDRSSDHDSSIP